MVDFRKAFDLGDHKILLKKLNLYKCSNLTLSWFSSYLSNRSQFVIINGIRSEKETVSCGILQGSILGPLLFLLFINDLPLTLKEVVSAVDLYTDDTTIYDIQTDKTLVQRNLQSALNLLHIWCKENGMLLNMDKTKEMFITTRQKRATLSEDVLALKYDGIHLHLSNNEKVLGLYIDEILFGMPILYMSQRRFCQIYGCCLK